MSVTSRSHSHSSGGRSSNRSRLAYRTRSRSFYVWRKTYWQKIRNHLSSYPTTPPEFASSSSSSPLSGTKIVLNDLLDADITILDHIADDVNTLKRGLLKRRAIEAEQAAAERTGSSGSPTATGPATPDLSERSFHTAIESPTEDPKAARRHTEAQQAEERRRKRLMARSVIYTSTQIKQEHARRLKEISDFDRLRRPKRVTQPPRRSSHQSEASISGVSTATPVLSSTESIYIHAWKRYIASWESITCKPAAQPPVIFTFSTFPWPTVIQPLSLADITKENVAAFIHHGPPSYDATSRPETKFALHEAVRRWHPDRSVWVSRVSDADKELTRKGADMVIRIVNQLSSDAKEERSSPPLFP